MKVNASKFVSEMKKIEEMLEINFDATGPTFTSKVLCVQKEVPKGVLDKLSFLANLLDQAQKGEKLRPADLKQAGFWIDAVWPYVSNGAPHGSGWRNRVFGAIVVLILLGAAYCVLR